MRARGFDVAAMDPPHRAEWERVHAGDRVLYYLSDVDAIGGIARVAGDRRDDETHELRFATELTVACEPGAYAAVEPLVGDLDERGSTGPAWRLAPSRGVHEISDADAEVLEGAVRLASGSAPTA